MLIGSEWEACDLSKLNFREADLSNAYFHGGQTYEQLGQVDQARSTYVIISHN